MSFLRLASLLACIAATAATNAKAAEPLATSVSAIKTLPGFSVELLYSVPAERYGSWVNLCLDPAGRLIVSDQYGSLHRVTLPDAAGEEVAIETIPVEIGEAQGLLWAFDSLYVVVNRGAKYEGGLYRVRDTDGDDQLDTVETLRGLEGRGEHGPHAILLAPDGASLYVVCGDGTKLTEFARSRVPRVWDEDLLLPRPYGRGFMKGVRAPGGYVAKIDPNGSVWELVAVGFRNQYDAALNRQGELFTFDADMEWDMNTPWYRPTRVCHVVSGADFGWRNGGGKWPAYYPDSLPAAVDIGPGSPTGVCFGYGSNFPVKYREALFALDWSYGKMYAVHLTPDGASYGGSFEEFLSGTPLPLTDVVINPRDGAMYFTIGGRKVQSGLYRVTYQGDDAATEGVPPQVNPVAAELRGIRHDLELLHVGDDPDAVERAWPYLDHSDRFLRHAARIAIEKRPLGEWRERAITEPDRQAALTALLALARQYEREDRGQPPAIDTPPPRWDALPELPAERRAARDEILSALADFDWSSLSGDQRIELLRVYSLTFLRIGPPTAAQRQQLIERFDPAFPSTSRTVNSELAQLLVYLQAPNTARKLVRLLEGAATQEEQMDLAKSLRHLRAGWTPELRERFFTWFTKAQRFRGGASFALFVDDIRQDAIAHLSDQERQKWSELLEPAVASQGTPPTAARPFVKDWTLKELLPLLEDQLAARDYERGRELFAAANCFGCHRFDNQGGAIGPDLTGISGRFSRRDLLESIVNPDKVISDQYAAVTVVTEDGQVVTGRIVNLNGDTYSINTDMLDPNKQTKVDRNEIDEMRPAQNSMMPRGLLNTLNREEILDLMAYLFSGGDPEHPLFR